MRRVILAALIMAGVVLLATPAEARPGGVTTAQWVDYCNHSTDLIIALNGIADAGSGGAPTYADMMREAARDFHRDAVKIRPKNERVGGQIEGLSRAVAKTRTTYLATGKLKLRGLQIASADLPGC